VVATKNQSDKNKQPKKKKNPALLLESSSRKLEKAFSMHRKTTKKMQENINSGRLEKKPKK